MTRNLVSRYWLNFKNKCLFGSCSQPFKYNFNFIRIINMLKRKSCKLVFVGLTIYFIFAWTSEYIYIYIYLPYFGSCVKQNRYKRTYITIIVSPLRRDVMLFCQRESNWYLITEHRTTAAPGLWVLRSVRTNKALPSLKSDANKYIIPFINILICICVCRNIYIYIIQPICNKHQIGTYFLDVITRVENLLNVNLI